MNHMYLLPEEVELSVEVSKADWLFGEGGVLPLLESKTFDKAVDMLGSKLI